MGSRAMAGTPRRRDHDRRHSHGDRCQRAQRVHFRAAAFSLHRSRSGLSSCSASAATCSSTAPPASRGDADEIAKLGGISRHHLLDNDFEVIPTPGHTPDATAYLWDSGEHRLLFTGDTIYLDEGEWVAAVLDSSDRGLYLESLELIRGLEFDVLAPWAATGGRPFLAAPDGGGRQAPHRRHHRAPPRRRGPLRWAPPPRKERASSARASSTTCAVTEPFAWRESRPAGPRSSSTTSQAPTPGGRAGSRSAAAPRRSTAIGP